MQEKMKEVMRFYLLATKLKYRIRSGWGSKLWNVKGDRLESIAEHVYGTCILAISLDSEFELNLDIEKILKMLTLHEIGEVLIGDITPFDGKSTLSKQEMEEKAMLEVLGDLTNKDELYSLLLEFDAKETKEAKFCYMCDKIEADIQAKVYQDMGLQHSLDNQKDNAVFNDPKSREMLKEGAKTAFDIWYMWDKPKYKDSEIFSELLEYLKNNDTNI